MFLHNSWAQLGVLRRLFLGDKDVLSICRKWQEPDPETWPLVGHASADGPWSCREYGLFSQNGEDGLLRHLISRIESPKRLFLEFGFSPTECNCVRLALKEGFGGLFIDGDAKTVERFNRASARFGLRNVRAVCEFLTVSNLDRVIGSTGIRGVIDVASIDVDGNDYWLWERLECVRPSIVVVEYNASFGPTRSVTVPYDPSFDRHAKHPTGLYHGASLAALQCLGARKGYRLVGCDSAGVNAFFLLDEVAPEMESVSSEQAFRPSRHRLALGLSTEEQFGLISRLPYIEVS